MAVKKLMCGAFCLLAGLAAFTISGGCKHSSDIVYDETIFSWENPITKSEADPWIYKHSDGYYYYTATNANFDRVEIRRAASFDELESTTERTTVMVANTGNFAGVRKYIWAPELHYLDGSWYLLYTGSVDSSVWSVRSHIAKCEGDDPFTGTWKSLGKIKGVTGDTFDAANDIMTAFNLDGTAFKQGDQWYYVWAQYLYGTEKATDDNWADENKSDGKTKLTLNGKTYTNLLGGNAWSCILIGKVVPGSDFTQITNATVISVPNTEWECGLDTSICAHTSGNVNVNEGPAILQRNGKIFIAFSAAACDESYCLGLLAADENADLCSMASWSKSANPVFTTSLKNGIYGPGHCSFTTDADGNDVIVYHARPYAGLRAGGAWNDDGTPAGNVISDGLNDGHRSARAKIFTWKDGNPNFGEAQ